MIPKNKDELISEIKKHFTTLWKDLETLPAELANRKELEWKIKDIKASVNNLISYLIWRWELVLKWERNFETPEELQLPEIWFKWNELGKLAQKFYKDYDHLDFSTLKALLRENNISIIKMLENHTNEELYQKARYTKRTFWRLVQLNTSSPYKNIRSRIRKYLKYIDTKK